MRAPLETLGEHLPAQRVLLVTTPGFVRRGVVQRVKDMLSSSHQVITWDGVKPNPDLLDLDAATHYFRSFEIGCVLGLGGGSAIDAAKVLATTIPSRTAPTLCQLFRDKVVPRWSQRLPLVVIPTTSGTGAEVTPFATVWDHKEHNKNSLIGEFLYPDTALLDATLTLTLGEEDTLYPALDTISHALESLWNKNCTPVTRIFAFQALALSNQALPLVMKEPCNLELRHNLQIASLLAGFAISQTKTAIAHSISYFFTAYHQVPHGLACSFTLSKLIELNKNTLSSNDSENEIINITEEILKKLDLSEKLKKYLPLNLQFKKNTYNFDSQRIDNYIGDITEIQSHLTKIIYE